VPAIIPRGFAFFCLVFSCVSLASQHALCSLPVFYTPPLRKEPSTRGIPRQAQRCNFTPPRNQRAIRAPRSCFTYRITSRRQRPSQCVARVWGQRKRGETTQGRPDCLLVPVCPSAVAAAHMPESQRGSRKRVDRLPAPTATSPDACPERRMCMSQVPRAVVLPRPLPRLQVPALSGVCTSRSVLPRRERERDASACMRRHQASALAPVRAAAQPAPPAGPRAASAQG